MDITIFPRRLQGTVCAIPSKSQAHRLLICAAFADRPSELLCPQTNQDIEATARCLNALGARILRTNAGYSVQPISVLPKEAILPCGESGSTLRFLLPIVGVLGVHGLFHMEGRLSQRPLSPLWEELERMGCVLEWIDKNVLSCTGKLRSGTYTIDGSVSSQYITGLLFALSVMKQQSSLRITGRIESAPYIRMTLQALEAFGVSVCADCLGGQSFHSPGALEVEGDWSNGAFFLAAKTLGNPIEVTGLSLSSHQGDKQVHTLLKGLKEHLTVDAANIPDLVPILAIAAAANKGAVFSNIRRLRLKESDRVFSVISMLQAFGVKAAATDNTLTVYPGPFSGGTVDSMGDHRIAMAAAIGATAASSPVTILGAQSVNKSYPGFWDEYKCLGGHYEQYIR